MSGRLKKFFWDTCGSMKTLYFQELVSCFHSKLTSLLFRVRSSEKGWERFECSLFKVFRTVFVPVSVLTLKNSLQKLSISVLKHFQKYRFWKCQIRTVQEFSQAVVSLLLAFFWFRKLKNKSLTSLNFISWCWNFQVFKHFQRNSLLQFKSLEMMDFLVSMVGVAPKNCEEGTLKTVVVFFWAAKSQ